MLVMYHDEKIEEGLSYTLDLARIMNKALSILIVYRRRVMERLEDYMVDVTFAEEGDFKTAREMITMDLKTKGIDYEERVRLIEERCNRAGVEFMDVSTSKDNPLRAIRNLLKDNSSIEMVLLGPSVTHDGYISAKELQRLVQELSRPIVTMTRNIKEKTA